MNFQFDLRGNLRPYEIIEADIENFQHSFCTSEFRVSIFEHFQVFLNRLTELLAVSFEIWIDGSFISKKSKPADIDVVVFIDNQTFIIRQEPIRLLFKEFDKQSPRLVDAYPVIVYPENHPNFNAYRSDNLYWLELFGKTRPNRADKQFQKGIIKIKI